ncbi:MAG: DUF456 domain-containing protein [Flavobacteriales bacterium]|jgi:uncharacterized protein YqgC (DUF456 family)|tara:strand:- start:7004 stop:7492 length:489 start_codon:yes stop_codon:yes gene_type:complete
MDLLFIVLGLILCIVGLIGSFVPIIPGPITSWLGLLTISFTSNIELSDKFLLISFIIAVFVFFLDIIIPIVGLKKFGGTNKGMIGATIGLLIGFFILGPFGIIIGPFIGAFSGEMIGNLKMKKVIKASIGTLIGFIGGIAIKFTISLIYLFIFLWEVVENVF